MGSIKEVVFQDAVESSFITQEIGPTALISASFV